MKKRISFFMTMAILLLFTNGYGQVSLKKVIERSKKKAEHNVENRVQRRIDKGVDKSLDSVEGGIEESVKGDDKSKADQSKKNDSTTDPAVNNPSHQQPATDEPLEASQKPQAPTLSWAKYDFIPGTEIIFEDNQEGELNGEFPSKWDLAGGVIENAFFDESNVIYFREMGNMGGITPLMKDSKSDYLPDAFTIEFDCYFDKEIYNQRYYLHFYALKKQKSTLNRLTLYINLAEYGSSNIQGVYPGSKRTNIDEAAHWRHIAISFNKRALKVYMDDTRLLNIPNIEENPTGLTIGTTSQKGVNYFVKNVRIAQGAVPLYDKFLTDGKFITTGIKFDVNKSTIKPESMGTINYVVGMMTDHPELKFSVEGHTDSDGEDLFNQKLSEARAKSVVEAMISLGISADRLTNKGWGESKPMVANDSPEGKAQNRRVEFVQF